jgi:hypothetical protein
VDAAAGARLRREMNGVTDMRLAICMVLVAVMAQERAPSQQPAARPQRTEADARARAEANRRERDEQRRKTGAPMELIADYIKANISPVPDTLGVSPFYKKYTDAMGIPVVASEKVPDAALLVARDIVNSMLAARPDIRKALIARKWRTGVIAELEMTMDIPEYERADRPRVRHAPHTDGRLPRQAHSAGDLQLTRRYEVAGALRM